MAYTAQLPVAAAPAAPAAPITGLLSAQPQQQGIQGLLSSFGDRLMTAPGPESLISTQFLANAFTSGADNRNIMSGIPEAVQNRQIGLIKQQEAQAAEEERQRQVEESNKTAEWVKTNFPQYANLPPARGFQLAMADLQASRKSIDPTAAMQEYQYAVGQGYEGTFADWKAGGSGAVTRANTATWLLDGDGNLVPGQMGNDGSLVPSAMPEGYTAVDPRTLAGERAAGTAGGKAGAEAAAAAPGDIAAGMEALNIIDQIKTSPELHWATGTSAGLGGNSIPGTGRYGFQNLVDQAKSGAFLTAVQTMRGLGALSNAEGQAATQAITRLNTALSTQDFLRALADYEAIVIRGIERAQARLASGGGAQAPATGGGWTVLGVE